MLYNDLKHVNVTNEIEEHTTWEFKSFQYIFLKWIISFIYGPNITRFGTYVVKYHSEGTVSQIFYLGPGFYFMKSRKLGCKKW